MGSYKLKIFTILCLFTIFVSFHTISFGSYSGPLLTVSGTYLDNTDFDVAVPEAGSPYDSYLLIDKYYGNNDLWVFWWDSTTTACFYSPTNGSVNLRSLSDLSTNSTGVRYTHFFNDYSFNVDWNYQGTFSVFSGPSATEKLYSTGDVYNYNTLDTSNISNNTIYVPKTSSFIGPMFDNQTELENSEFEWVMINHGDLTVNDTFYLHILTVTNYVTSPNPIYYYNDKVFILNKNSDYYRDFADIGHADIFDYQVPRYDLGLQPNTSYVYVLSDSSNPINASNGMLERDDDNGTYDVVSADTSGIITQAQADSDTFRRMEQSMQETQQTQNNIQQSLTDTNISNDTINDIDTNLSYNNNNEVLTNARQGFFTRLSVMLSNLTLYNINDDTSVTIPVPFTSGSITLHSIDINNNVTGAFRVIVDLFWTFIFSFYLYKFINHLYISVTTGKILKDFEATTETISNHML